MLSDKELKKKFKSIFSDNKEKYYPVNFLMKEGFHRGKCEKCGKYFWSQDKTRKLCGDSECIGKITLFSDKTDIAPQSYVDVWTNYSKFFKKRNYIPIKRYPVVARWNSTVDFTIASIAAFQPYVVSGEVDPPSKQLVIPQFCLRFGDVDNVGITGSHCTGFVMIGQHVFVPKDEWDQEKLFKDMYEYIIDIVGLNKDLLVLHEDAWAGGGNYGPCMEFFSCGIELFNQVYMMFEHTENKDKELNVKVLDMGHGMERIAWFTQVTPTLYDAIMPKTLYKLKKKIGVEFNYDIFKKFVPYSSLLNIDEVDDINSAWKFVADKVGISVDKLKLNIEPMTAIYSIAEHTRSLLVAISDGGLPSNTGGGYNLRGIIRRALNFIRKNSWNISLSQIVEWHAEELKELYPELLNNLKEVKEILDYETEKYYESIQRNKQIIENFKGKAISVDKLIELYDSKGIIPEEIAKVVNIKIPDNFYSLVAERHEKSESKTQTTIEFNLDITNINKTKILYYDDYNLTEFNATIIKIIDNNVILDETAFYPTSGGQLHDLGKIDGTEIINVIKQGRIVIHVVKNASSLKENSLVHCSIDSDRRLQLAQHHTATHIVNGAARSVLGNHIWQAGASKTLEKARLDITHYKSISSDELNKIEEIANEKIKENITIISSLLPRSIAEEKYGFRLYQGGAVPGKIIRIIDIPDFDVEACGGTHLHSTSEVSLIKILKSSKLQDGIVRIEFTAGQAAVNMLNVNDSIVDDFKILLSCEESQILGRVEELFLKWKKVKKLEKKNKKIDSDLLILNSDKKLDSTDIIGDSAVILKTQKDHVIKTIKRFLDDLKNKN